MKKIKGKLVLVVLFVLCIVVVSFTNASAGIEERKETLLNAADYFLAEFGTENHFPNGYSFRWWTPTEPFQEGWYEYPGQNAQAALVLLCAYRISGIQAYLNKALDVATYILDNLDRSSSHLNTVTGGAVPLDEGTVLSYDHGISYMALMGYGGAESPLLQFLAEMYKETAFRSLSVSSKRKDLLFAGL